MSDPFSDRYWVEEFQVTEADLDRIEKHIRETSQAQELTTLAQRVVRGRLRYGPEEQSVPAQSQWTEDESVRLWDPGAQWEIGDHAIVAVGFLEEGSTVHKPFVGEITQIKEGTASVRIDALEETRKYNTQESADTLEKWRRFVQGLVEARRGARDIETQTEYVILEHGKRVISQLLEALRTDDRFVRLAGRWFLRELVVPVTDEQLSALAWAMVPLDEPKSTADLVPLLDPPLAEGDPGLFGLYLAMRESDRFENADPGQRPRWVLAGPPPGTCTAQHAVYDPETYEVLCLPGESISADVVEQLWEAQLLQAVLGSS
jgi:hypothetical protein